MFMNLIQRRRSIRKFLDKPVEGAKINVLIEAALRAPSSRGINPWEFVMVADRDQLRKLSQMKEHGSTFLEDAPLAIVVCADPGKSDVWIEDTSIAAIYIQLAAESLGLGSCWIQVRERMHDGTRSAQEYVLETLNIPATMGVECIIAIGYPDEEKAPHRKEELLYEKVHRGIYGSPYYTAIV